MREPGHVNMQSEHSELAIKFHQYFDVGLALTPDELERSYRIRYRVYCEEFGFLPAENYSGELESDEYDDFSQTCLITHRSSNMPAACVRLVPGVNGTGDSYPLPYELLGPEVLDQDFHNQLDVPRHKIVEISRLAVDGAFRRRKGEKETRFGEIDTLNLASAERRTFGLLSVAAFLATCVMGDLGRYTTGFAMMEPFLPRLMQRSGIKFTKVGSDIDYHGARAPYYVRLDAVLESMDPDMRLFYQSIYREIKRDLAARAPTKGSLNSR